MKGLSFLNYLAFVARVVAHPNESETGADETTAVVAAGRPTT